MSQSPNNNSTHVGVDVSPVAGPVMLGYFFEFGLYGALSSQVYIYHQPFPTDKRRVKFLVYGIYILATLQSALNTHDSVVALASHFGNIDELVKGHFTYLAAPILTGAIALIVQSFYAFRIYILTDTRIFPAIIAILSIIQCGAAFAAGILEVPIGDDLRKIPHFKRLRFTEGSWVVSSGVCDIIIAACMWYQVYYGYSKAGISGKTQSLLIQVVRLIVGTGAMTAIVAVAAVVLFGRFPDSIAYATPCAILAQLYSNSMLVVLNNRLRLKDSMDTLTTNDIELISTFQTRHIIELESQH